MSENAPQPGDSKNTLFTLFFGGIFACTGAFLVMVALGIIPSSPDAFHVPHWVVGVMGAAFMFGGMMIALQGAFSPAARQTALYKWLQYISTLGFLATFSSAFAWLGLGPGEREFSGSVSLGPLFFWSSNVSDLAGRCMFGGFGLLLILVTLWFAIVEPLRILGFWPGAGKEEEER